MKLLKWLLLIIISSCSIIMIFVWCILSNVEYSISKPKENLYDITNWYVENENLELVDKDNNPVFNFSNVEFNYDVYSFNDGNDKYIITNDNLIQLVSNQYENISTTIESELIDNKYVHEAIEQIFVSTTNFQPSNKDYYLKLNDDINVESLVNNSTFSSMITVIASNESLILKKQTSFSFPFTIKLNIKTQFDINAINNLTYKNVLFFNTSDPTYVQVNGGDLDTWETYDYAAEGLNDHIELLKNEINQKIKNKTGYWINDLDHIKLEINQAKKIYINPNFTFYNSVEFLLWIEDEPFIDATQIIVANIYMGANNLITVRSIAEYIELLPNEEKEYSFYSIDPKNISNYELENYIWTTPKLYQQISDAIKLLIANLPSLAFDENDNLTIQYIKTLLKIEINSSYRYIRDYSIIRQVTYTITSANQTKISGYSQDITVSQLAIYQIDTVITKFSDQDDMLISFDRLIQHEGVESLIAWYPSYGEWVTKLLGVNINISFNRSHLTDLKFNKIYTYNELIKLNFFANGGDIPSMLPSDGSMIQLHGNDYIGVDFPWVLSWFHVIAEAYQNANLDVGTFSLSETKPIYYGQNWDEYGKDWILPGSKKHDFHLRLYNFWDHLFFEKIIYDGGTPTDPSDDMEILSPFFGSAQNQILWDFARDSKFSTSRPISYAVFNGKPHGSFNLNEHGSIIEYESAIKQYA